MEIWCLKGVREPDTPPDRCSEFSAGMRAGQISGLSEEGRSHNLSCVPARPGKFSLPVAAGLCLLPSPVFPFPFSPFLCPGKFLDSFICRVGSIPSCQFKDNNNCSL